MDIRGATLVQNLKLILDRKRLNYSFDCVLKFKIFENCICRLCDLFHSAVTTKSIFCMY